MFIGLTSPASGGKEIVKKRLEEQKLREKGFVSFRISDFIREAAVLLNRNPDEREVLQNTGNEFRANFGSDYWVKLIDEMISIAGITTNIIIDGIRNPEEINYLRNKYKEDFYLVGITVEPEKQRSFIKGRERAGDNTHNDTKLESILRRDLGIGEAEHGQQVSRCLEMADYTIENDSDIGKLRDGADEILEALKNDRHLV